MAVEVNNSLRSCTATDRRMREEIQVGSLGRECACRLRQKSIRAPVILMQYFPQPTLEARYAPIAVPQMLMRLRPLSIHGFSSVGNQGLGIGICPKRFFRATPLASVYTADRVPQPFIHFQGARLGCLVSTSHAPREVTIYANFAEKLEFRNSDEIAEGKRAQKMDKTKCWRKSSNKVPRETGHMVQQAPPHTRTLTHPPALFATHHHPKNPLLFLLALALAMAEAATADMLASGDTG
jgi:hypothetical protein